MTRKILQLGLPNRKGVKFLQDIASEADSHLISPQTALYQTLALNQTSYNL